MIVNLEKNRQRKSQRPRVQPNQFSVIEAEPIRLERQRVFCFVSSKALAAVFVALDFCAHQPTANVLSLTERRFPKIHSLGGRHNFGSVNFDVGQVRQLGTSVIKYLATQAAHYMLTPFDDPQLVRFLRSMPYAARRNLCTRAIGERVAKIGVVSIVPSWALFGFTGQWLGSFFDVGSVGFLLGLVVGSAIAGASFTIYRNRRLRELLLSESRDGLISYCPVCEKRQAPDAQILCECGCIVRPFQSIRSNLNC